MAAEVAQIAGDVANLNALTPPDETSPALNNTLGDRPSPSDSPEPGEDTYAGSAKDAASCGTNGESGAAGNKGESKGAPVKTKKKEDKSIEYILRALSSLNSPEEKLAALCKKYADMHEEHRVLQSSFKQQQRRMTVVQREKDQLQAEHTKAVMAKSKLESLCRELQKQNRVVKEESLIRAKEDEERRKEISNKFQKTIEEIQTQMTENHERNVKLREENLQMAEKLKHFIEQYELREQQVTKMAQHRDLEKQLFDAKQAQAAAILREKETLHLKEKEELLIKVTEVQKRNAMLDAQVSMYKDRYDEFRGTIDKSNTMFQNFKTDMEKMGKRIKKLEKEGAQWRAKYEASNQILLEMAEEKTRADKEKQTLQVKVGKLESLCRALQGELHGKKGASAESSVSSEAAIPMHVPVIIEEAASSTTTATANPTINSISTSTTTTPPNTPEDSGSRASPSPDSVPTLPALLSLPNSQNGPKPSDSEEAVSTEEAATESCAGDGSAVKEVSSSSDVGESVSQAQASASSSGPDQDTSVSSSAEVYSTASDHSTA